jgi:hypothetical protein
MIFLNKDILTALKKKKKKLNLTKNAVNNIKFLFYFQK